MDVPPCFSSYKYGIVFKTEMKKKSNKNMNEQLQHLYVFSVAKHQIQRPFEI